MNIVMGVLLKPGKQEVKENWKKLHNEGIYNF
jgi:hypothetical protein